MEAAWRRTDFERQRAQQPNRLAVHKTLHVLAADEREVVAEARPVQFDQPAAVAGLLLPHAFEHLGGSRDNFREVRRRNRRRCARLLLRGRRRGREFHVRRGYRNCACLYCDSGMPIVIHGQGRASITANGVCRSYQAACQGSLPFGHRRIRPRRRRRRRRRTIRAP